jgi:hypothetical protein
VNPREIDTAAKLLITVLRQTMKTDDRARRPIAFVYLKRALREEDDEAAGQRRRPLRPGSAQFEVRGTLRRACLLAGFECPSAHGCGQWNSQT